MIKAKDIMNADVVTVDPEDMVEEVMRQMTSRSVSGLPVVDMSGQLVGIITEFDLLALVWDPTTGKSKVYHYMTRETQTVDENDELFFVAEKLRKHPVRRLVVMRGERVVGIISRRDLIRHVLRIRGELVESAQA